MEDNRQEWTFTLYGFDNRGKATREVMHLCLGQMVHGAEAGRRQVPPLLVSMMGRLAEPSRVGGEVRMGVQEGATAGARQPLEPRLPVLFPAEPCTASGSPLRPSQASSPPAGASTPRSSPGALPC